MTAFQICKVAALNAGPLRKCLLGPTMGASQGLDSLGEESQDLGLRYRQALSFRNRLSIIVRSELQSG